MFSSFTSTFIVLAACVATASAQLGWAGASWIWSSDAVAPPRPRYPEQRAFRKEFPTNPCNPPTSVEIMLTADDAFTLYVNGVEAGSANGQWATPKYFCVPINPADLPAFGNRVVIALVASNTVYYSYTGLIVSGKFNNYGGDSSLFVTDGSWLSSLTVPSGFQAPNYNDSTWRSAVVEDSYDRSVVWVPHPEVYANQTCSLCPASTKILM